MNDTHYKYKYLKYKNKYRQMMKEMNGGKGEEICEQKISEEINNKIKEENKKEYNNYENLKKILSEECGYDTNEKTMGNEINLVNDELKCVLVSNKCGKEYYKHTYNVDLKSHILYKYIENKDDFDVTKRENCCNCIAISIYSKRLTVDLVKYIASICRTIKNVGMALPDWIVRVYMDISVYNYIKLLENGLKKDVLTKYIKLMTTSKNTELYTYVCNYPGDFKYSKLRIQRFYSLCNEDTNIVVIREADGIVSLQDCINIKAFEQSNKILYILPLLGDNQLTYVRKVTNNSNEKIKIYKKKSYQTWLNVYKNYIDYDYFQKKWNYYDMLAGCFASKIKIKKEAFIKSVKYVQQKISFLCENLYTIYEEKFPVETKKLEPLVKTEIPKIIYECYDKIIKSNHEIEKREKIESFEKICYIGFDEMLLLNIFKDFISVTYKKKSNGEPDYVIVDDKSNEFRDIVNHINIKTVNPENIKENYERCCEDIMKIIGVDSSSTFQTGDVLGEVSCKNMVNNIIYDKLLYNYVTNNKITDKFYNVPCEDFGVKLQNSSLMNFINVPYDSENGIFGHLFDEVYDNIKIVGRPNIFKLYDNIRDDGKEIKSKIYVPPYALRNSIITDFFCNSSTYFDIVDNIYYDVSSCKPSFEKYIEMYEGPHKDLFNSIYEDFEKYDSNLKKIFVLLFKIYKGERAIYCKKDFNEEKFLPIIWEDVYTNIKKNATNINEYLEKHMDSKIKNIEKSIESLNEEYNKIYNKKFKNTDIFDKLINSTEIVPFVKKIDEYCDLIINKTETYSNRVFNISKLLMVINEYNEKINSKFNVILTKNDIKVCSMKLDREYESQI